VARYGGWTLADIARINHTTVDALLAESPPATPKTGSRRVGGRHVQASTAGKREALQGLFVRSRWEANVGLWLQWQGIPFQYEPRRFVFPGITGANASYLPDFYLLAEDRYLEVKGWLAPGDQTKLKRMATHYPEVRIELIRGPFFRELCRTRVCQLIPGYECRHTGYR